MCHDHLRVVPGHSGAGEGGCHRGDGGHDFDLQAELGCAQGAYDAEESRVPVGEDDGGAPVARDTAGGEGDAAQPDAFGVLGHFGEFEMVGRGRTSVAAPRAERAASASGEPSQPITVTRSAIVVSLQKVFAGLGCSPGGLREGTPVRPGGGVAAGVARGAVPPCRVDGSGVPGAGIR